MTDPRNTNPDSAENRDSALPPDPETLHTPDPQKNMEGPVSTSMHKAGEAFDTDETEEEADEKKREAGI